MICRQPLKPPDPIDSFLSKITALFDQRHAELVEPLFLGELLAHGRRTATAWFRAGGISDDFRRAYTLLGTLGRSKVPACAAVLFADLRGSIDPGPHWLFAIDDSPTPRYGPCVEGAGLHHNPTPGPAQQQFVYGHIWVTTAWVVRHPQWDTLALPLLADLYIRDKDLPKIDPDRRPDFVTKLALAVSQIHWLAEQVRGSDRPLWAVVDGFYTKRPVFRAAHAEGVVLVGRLRWDAALRDLPPPVPEGQRGRGRPPTYGKRRLSLAKRAGHAQGWEAVTCFQYQEEVTKTVKTFLATWPPAGGVIRVVIVKEADGSWRAYCCTAPAASVRDILEAAAGRTAIEQTFKEVKEVEGAGEQQLRYWRANEGAYHWCLWGYTVVEWWAWKRPFAQLCDRTASPWDRADRRPSHADRRKALQRQLLSEEFWRCWGEGPCPAEIRALVEALVDRAA
jgi:DDE superfamily endonuclease